MRRIASLALVLLPTLIVSSCQAPPSSQTPEAQETRSPGLDYHLESDHIAMADVGRLLARLGMQIQEEGRVTLGGSTHSLAGHGSVELSLRDRGDRTGFALGLSSAGDDDPPGRGGAYTLYQRGGRGWAPADVADLVAELADSLAGTGRFVMEDHSVAFEGSAIVDERLVEHPRRTRRPYTLDVHVTFAEGEFSRHDDMEDYEEDAEAGRLVDLGQRQMEGASRETVVETFSSLAEELRAGRVRVGDGELDVGERVRFGLAHVSATEGPAQKIELSLRFGPAPERRRDEEPRFGDEVQGASMTEVAELLRRMADEIQADGTFELGGEVFTVEDSADYEIHANPRGFAIELGYVGPPRR